MSRKIRVRPTIRIPLVVTVFPVIFEVVLLSDILRGRDSISTSISLLLVLGVPLTAFILHFWVFYYLELDDQTLRMVKYYGIGSRAIPLNRLSGVNLNRARLGWFKVQFESSEDGTIAIMPNAGRLWPMARLAHLVSTLASRGVPVSAEVRTYLSVQDANAASNAVSDEQPRPASAPTGSPLPFWVMAPVLWLVVFLGAATPTYVLGNFGLGVILGALTACGTMVSLYIAYRVNRWL